MDSVGYDQPFGDEYQKELDRIVRSYGWSEVSEVRRAFDGRLRRFAQECGDFENPERIPDDFVASAEGSVFVENVEDVLQARREPPLEEGELRVVFEEVWGRLRPFWRPELDLSGNVGMLLSGSGASPEDLALAVERFGGTSRRLGPEDSTMSDQLYEEYLRRGSRRFLVQDITATRERRLREDVWLRAVFANPTVEDARNFDSELRRYWFRKRRAPAWTPNERVPLSARQEFVESRQARRVLLAERPGMRYVPLPGPGPQSDQPRYGFRPPQQSGFGMLYPSRQTPGVEQVASAAAGWGHLPAGRPQPSGSHQRPHRQQGHGANPQNPGQGHGPR
ncbi:hypothetical protein ABT336_12715 [Micromonospora sp. NPDC000207]|uniref:hypothetical protein n=1 Tax=Micromonospora sp. NPDC000207 TaxID=3154246 RepID=UPI00332B2CE8